MPAETGPRAECILKFLQTYSMPCFSRFWAALTATTSENIFFSLDSFRTEPYVRQTLHGDKIVVKVNGEERGFFPFPWCFCCRKVHLWKKLCPKRRLIEVPFYGVYQKWRGYRGLKSAAGMSRRLMNVYAEYLSPLE